jgi:hypothetical protein
MTQRVTLVKAESPGSPEIPLNVDSSGNIGVNVESGGSGGSVSGTVKVSDGTTATQLLAVDASGRVTAVLSSQAFTNTVLSNVADATATHWLGTKDEALAGCISGNAVAISNTALTDLGNCYQATATYWIATKDLTLAAMATTPINVGGTVAVTNLDTSINTLFTSTGIKVGTLPDCANAVLTAVKDTIGHTLGVQIKGVRTAAASCIAHRSSLTAADVLGGTNTAPTVPTVADSGIAEGGLTHAPTTWYAAYVVRNGMGVTMASAVGSVSLSAAHSIRITIPAAWGSSLTDTDLTYEIFLSTDTAPKHVCTFTAAQLAAGGTTRCSCTTAETPIVSGAGGANWTCDIGVTGANAQTTAAQFQTSTALSQATIAGLSAVSTSGYNNIDLFIDAQMTAYTTTAPSLTLVPVFLNDKQGTNYHVGAPIYVNLLNGAGQAFRQTFNLTTNGASVMILVASITNVTVNRIDITPTSVV